MRECADIPGVLPLWDYNAPDEPRQLGDAWLVSPFATTLADEPPDRALERAVEIVASLADTLAKVHARGYSHRDIKPENIFFWNERWQIGDFGIAAGPNIPRHTQPGERVGPILYSAPEMLNAAADAEGRPADVYSMAKLLWKLATGQTYPLQGLQPRDVPAVTIAGALDNPRAYPLDALIDAATQTEPPRRPSMAVFAESLAAWLRPPLVPTGPVDLSDLTSKSAVLLQPHKSKQERRAQIARNAENERSRFFKQFASVMSEMRVAIEAAQIGDVNVVTAAGGNARFTDPILTRGRRFYEFSFDVTMRDDERYVVLRGGTNLGVREGRDEDGAFEDIYSQAFASVGYALEVSVAGGTSYAHILWSQQAEFLLGTPSETAAIAPMIEGLRQNLRPSVIALQNEFETARPASLDSFFTDES